MYIKKLFRSDTLKDDNGNGFTVNYYITKETSIIAECIPPYGISIEKTAETNSADVYSAARCFTSEKKAELLLCRLSDYSVTPVSAEEAIEALICNCDSVL